MVIGVCRVEIFIPNIGSLKEKRQIIKSLLKQIRNKFNISVAELEDMDLWQKDIIGFACISNSSTQVNKLIHSVVRYFEEDGRFEVSKVDIEIL